jgi:beta-lactamase superfamily II metal-dependent hydrolase
MQWPIEDFNHPLRLHQSQEKSMLDIHIFDVDHGFCAAIDRSNHNTILIDTGFNSRTGFSPWQHLLKRHCRTIDCLVMPAYDPDHLTGIPTLLDHCLEHGLNINLLVANPTIADQYPELKAASLWAKNSLDVTTKMHPECHKISQNMKIDDVGLSFFWNDQDTYHDSHDLSLVTFVSYDDIEIVFPSNLTVAGWRALLQCEDFRAHLRRVNTFVAANHGHESGYCPEIFNYCRPDVVLISNQGNQRVSPAMLNQYTVHAKGASDRVCDRKVFTTYDNGTITISKCLDRLRHITAKLVSRQLETVA